MKNNKKESIMVPLTPTETPFVIEMKKKIALYERQLEFATDKTPIEEEIKGLKRQIGL